MATPQRRPNVVVKSLSHLREEIGKLEDQHRQLLMEEGNLAEADRLAGQIAALQAELEDAYGRREFERSHYLGWLSPKSEALAVE